MPSPRQARSNPGSPANSGEIAYVIGDATNPVGSGAKLIAHIVNDLGRWGKGFVLALSGKWSEPESEYRSWYNSGIAFGLGKIQIVRVTRHIEVVNMVAQHGTRTGSHGPPIRYQALEECLTALARVAEERSASVHMPRIGAGLAGGRWGRIEPIIEEALVSRGVRVTVYTPGAEAAHFARPADVHR